MAIIEKQNKKGRSFEVKVYLPKNIQVQYNLKRISKSFSQRKKAEQWEKQKKIEIKAFMLSNTY